MAGAVAVGTGCVEVEVPPGTAMAGYAARTGPSEGVHDPLTVRALLLDGVALLTVDVCALHERTIAAIRQAVPAQVRASIVTATHTHSGPSVTFGRLGPHADQVHECIVEAAGEAIRRAVRTQQRCQVHYGRTPGLGFAHNRRHSDASTDPPLQFLRFDHADATTAWLVVYPSHPVVLDAANRSISGDYPAALRTRLEAAAPGALCVFATGAAGDRNPGDHTPESSFAAEASATRTFAAATRIGEPLAEAVLQTAIRPVASGPVTTATVPIELSFEVVGAAQAEAERAAWAAELAAGTTDERRALLTAWIAWADDLLAGRLDIGAGEPGTLDRSSLDHGEPTWPASVTAVGLGDVRLVTLPGEPFLATAERIATAAGHETLVLGYANGCPGYLPPEEEYAHGGYEVVDAHRYYGMPGPFAPGSAERLEAAAAAALTGRAGAVGAAQRVPSSRAPQARPHPGNGTRLRKSSATCSKVIHSTPSWLPM